MPKHNEHRGSIARLETPSLRERRNSTVATPQQQLTCITDGLIRVYGTKMRDVEASYAFDAFFTPLLADSDIEAKPMVLLLGQYSTGKTTFIQSLLQTAYPGAHIGPEPTTDRFIAVMHGDDERVIPGNAAAVQADRPFQGLAKFGAPFLSKFQVSQSHRAPLLESITFIDTPGILAGDKQKLGRAYDFEGVVGWFAERADMILLMFDAHKLDISDELRGVISVLRPYDDKIKIVLNKADGVSSQQLMRVYGALMWSLGKVVQTPEVMRVYIVSLYEDAGGAQKEEAGKTTTHSGAEKKADDFASQLGLLAAEQADLLSELLGLPRNSTMRKLNDFVRRARLLRVHVIIMERLRAAMPAIFGRASKQAKLIRRLQEVFEAVCRSHRIPLSDFPPIAPYQRVLSQLNLAETPRASDRTLADLDAVIAADLPELMRRFPQGPAVPHIHGQNPFNNGLVEAYIEVPENWDYESIDVEAYTRAFHAAHPVNGLLSGTKCRSILVESGLSNDDLANIWTLADIDHDGALSLDEYCIAMHLVRIRMTGGPVPFSLPETLLPLNSSSSVAGGAPTRIASRSFDRASR